MSLHLQTKLGEICRVINGRAYKKEELLEDGLTPVLRVGNFFTSDKWYYSDLKLEPEKYCDTGDLLYAWSASFGPRIWEGGRVIYHYHIWKMVPDEAKVFPRWLYYWLLWDTEGIKHAHGVGATMLHVTKGAMEQRSISVPPLTEQKQIVAILDEAFEGIAKATENAERNRANARTIFLSRLDAEFEAGRNLWNKTTVGEVGQVQTGTTPKSSNPSAYGDAIPFIKPGDFQLNGSLNYTNDGLSLMGAKASRTIQPDSALMVCIGATIGKTGYTSRPITANQQVNSLTPKPGIMGRFVFYQMRTTQFQARVIESASQATLPIINKTKWSSLPLFVPNSLSLQGEICSRLDSIEGDVSVLTDIYTRKIKAFSTLKQSLLMRAFSGQPTGTKASAA